MSSNIQFEIKQGEVPKLNIDGEQCGVVSMSYGYVTSDNNSEGARVVVIRYITKHDNTLRVFSSNEVTGEVQNYIEDETIPPHRKSFNLKAQMGNRL